MKITISKENYVKAIAEAEAEGEIVKASTLSRWLAVSAPAVTMAVKRLRRDGLIEADDSGQLTLTPQGRGIALRLLCRHHLIERMLAEIFGMEWYKVHDEAEQLEHAVSADFEQKLAERLGGGACPHGSLELDTPAARRNRGLRQLGEARPGDCVVVAIVHERDRSFLEFLDNLGIRPGVQLRLSGDGDPICLEAGRRRAELKKSDAARIWVRQAG